MAACWHVTCEHVPKNRSMAAKVKMLTLLQGIRGFAQIANRRPPPRSPGLVLAQMRVHGIYGDLRPRKLNIAFDQQSQPNIPHRVKITHVKPHPQPPAVLRAP